MKKVPSSVVPLLVELILLFLEAVLTALVSHSLRLSISNMKYNLVVLIALFMNVPIL